jgi:hypothetical protein
MSRVQLWLLIALAVVTAAFVTGLFQGLTDTVPVDLRPSSSPSAQP